MATHEPDGRFDRHRGHHLPPPPPAPPVAGHKAGDHTQQGEATERNGLAPRVRRGVDVSAIGTIVMGLPWFVYSAVVVAAVLGGGLAALTGLGVAGPVVVVAVWLLSGTLAFHRPSERFVARHVFALRPPSAAERRRLEPAWRAVTGSAGVDSASYELWVEESDLPNASASMGHNVSATTAALHHLPSRQLTAVLAHEFGHHVGGHAWSSLLMWWYSLPGRIFTRTVVLVVGGLLRALIAMFPIIGLFIVGLLAVGIVSAAFTLISNPIVAATLVIALLSPAVVPWLSRRGELRADRAAIDLGFGQELVESFDEVVALDLEPVRPTVRGRMFASHPAMDVRIRKAREYLAAR